MENWPEMRCLIDTNIFLEVILEQEKSRESLDFLSKTNVFEFFVTDYTLHSIGALLVRRRLHEVFQQFLSDMLLDSEIEVISVLAEEMPELIKAAKKFNLDFDDAYQYLAARKYDLILVSFDADFDRTDRGRKMPSQVLK